MKILDKIGLVLFSTIVLIIGLAILLTMAEWLKLELLLNSIIYITTDSLGTKIALVITTIIILLALKCIFFNSDANSTNGSKDGILLENDNGKLLVSRDTIESLTNTVVKKYQTAQNVMTKVEIDDTSCVSVFVTLFVYPDAVIKDLTISLQKDIKEAIKKSLDLDVKDVNVRIKNIAIKKEKEIKE